MTKAETVKILTFLAVNYESIDKKLADENKSNILVDVWFSCLSDLDYNLCAKACQKHIIQSKFSPTVNDIREAVLDITTKKDSPIDYWNEAYKMLSNGAYMTKEEFDKHSEICKRYFGTVDRLIDKARTEDLNLEVEQSLFNKTAETLIKQEKQDMLLPKKMKEQIKALAENMSATKLIGG